jgi:hypothetical protein
MTVTQPTSSKNGGPVTVDLYRDIHKGIRAELFAVTLEAGRADPGAVADRTAVAGHVRAVVEVLESHASHEDRAIQPMLEVHLPALAARIQADHERFTGRTAELASLADDVAQSGSRHAPTAVRSLYFELAEFTGVYLAHQDLEERTVLRALDHVLGPDALLRIHGAIIASIPPDEMARSLAFMLPAMNIDDRAQLLGGMRLAAPPPVFEGVWALASTVLGPSDQGALATRMGIG